jgi:hypothetical protein
MMAPPLFHLVSQMPVSLRPRITYATSILVHNHQLKGFLTILKGELKIPAWLAGP